MADRIMSFGQTLMLGGILLAALGVAGLAAGLEIIRVKRKKLKKKLYDRYGF